MDSSVKSTNCKKQKQSAGQVMLTNNDQIKNEDHIQLPEEVLEMIFSHLASSSNDMVNLSRASKNFYRILHPSANLWLFEKVFPFLFPYLDTDDIFNCRLTCKTWKNSVTTFLRNPSTFHSFPSLITKGLDCIDFQRAKYIKRFMKQMKNHSVNPFVLDFIMFKNRDELFHYYWDHMYELLSKFGHHITQIRLDLDSNHHPKPLAKYKVFRKVLSRLPNLKHLSMRGLLSSSTRHKEYNALETSFNTLKKYVEKYPLPPLPHLESISIEDKKFDLATCPFLLRTVLESYGSQLTSLYKSVRIWNTNNFHSTNFPKLVDLRIVDCEKYLEPSDVLDSLNAPNLQKLSISGFHLDGEKQLPSLFKSLHDGNFPLLRSIALSYYISDKLPQGPDDECYSVLPNVSTLKIVECREKPNKTPMKKVFEALPNLEHIFMVSDLTFEENLEVQRKRGMVELKADNLQIRDWAARGKMYHCQVWKILPKLKEIRFGFFGEDELSTEVVKVKTFTRQKYNHFMCRPEI